MEKGLERVMDEALASKGVHGCLFANHQGLCLGAKGKASSDSAGIIVAIAEEAGKIEPQSGPPVITFSNSANSCIIKRNGAITGAIYKKNLQ